MIKEGEDMLNIFKNTKSVAVNDNTITLEIRPVVKRFSNPVLNEIYEENERIRRELNRLKSSYYGQTQ